MLQQDHCRMIVPLILVALAGAAAAQDAGPGAHGTVAIEGEVVLGSAGGFELLTGPVRLDIVMEDWDWYYDYSVLDNDRVVVYGPMSRELFDTHSFRPHRVYVADVRSYYVRGEGDGDAAATGTEAPIVSHFSSTEPAADTISVIGSVTAVGGDEVILEAGGVRLTVETGEMAGTPALEPVLAEIGVDDRLLVIGEPAADFLRNQTIIGIDVVKLADPATTESASPR